MRDDNRATIELFEARKRIAELEMLNREHLKTIARDDDRLAELHDAKVSAGKDNNAYAKRILEQDRRIAELEYELEKCQFCYDKTLPLAKRIAELEYNEKMLRKDCDRLRRELDEEMGLVR